MKRTHLTYKRRLRRDVRARSRVSGTLARPRLAVFRSLRGMYAQLIDDEKGHTLVAVHAREVKQPKKTKSEVAVLIGTSLAQKAKKAGLTQAVFDKGPYKFHGRVKALVDAARAEGLRI